MIANVKRGGMRREEIVKRLETIFGKGSGQEIDKIDTNEKIAERIEELSKREEQYEKWEKMRQDTKRKQREDRRINIFWRKTSAFRLGLEATKKHLTLKIHCASGKASTTRKWRTDGEKSSLFKKFFEKCGRSSRTGNASGKHSTKMNSARSSDTRLNGRHAASTAFSRS